MKKFLIIFVGLMMVLPAFATGGEGQEEQNSETPTYPTDVVVSASYVKGAYDAALGEVNTTIGALTNLDTTAKTNVVAAVNEVNTAVAGKQATLTSSNVTTTGTGPVITSVSADNGTVAVTAGEITIPVGAASGNSVSGHATVWLE